MSALAKILRARTSFRPMGREIRVAVVMPGVEFTFVLPSNSFCPTFRTSVVFMLLFTVRL